MGLAAEIPSAYPMSDLRTRLSERVAELPESGSPLIDDDLHRKYRRVLAKSHWICYSYDETTLTVWHVFHVTQDHDAYGFEILDG